MTTYGYDPERDTLTADEGTGQVLDITDRQAACVALNLLTRIVEGLERQAKPGDVLRRTWRQEIEKAVGIEEANAAVQRALKINDSNPAQRERWAQESEARAAFLRTELARLEEQP